MSFSTVNATLGVDNAPFIAGLKNSQSAVDAFANNFQARMGRVFQGDTAAQKYFKSITTGSNTAHSAASKLTGGLEKMGNTFTGGLGIGFAIGGLAALTGAFTRAIEKARLFQTGMLSIAAAQQSAFEIKAGDKLLEGVEGFKASLYLSEKIQDELLKRSAKNILTYKEQLDSYLVSTSQAAKMGLSIKQQVQLSESLAVAAKSLGLEGQQISQQVRSVLNGANAARSVLGSNLGITNAQIRLWKQQGTLFDELMKRTKGFTAGSKDFQNSIEGMLSNFQNAIDLFLAGAGKKIAEAVKAPLKDIQQFLQSEGGEKLGEALGKIFATLLQMILNFARSPALPIIINFLKFLAEFGDKIIIVAAFVKLTAVLASVSKGAASLVGWLKGVATESMKAASGVEALKAAEAGGGARGGNSPGRFRGAIGEQLSLPFAANEGLNRGGRAIDTATGRYLPGTKTGPNAQPTLTGFSEAEAAANRSALAKMSAAQTAQRMSKIVDSESKGFFAAQKQLISDSFAAVKNKMSQIDPNAAVGAIGMAALIYTLFRSIGTSVASGMEGVSAETKDDVSAASKVASGLIAGAAGGAMVGGPIGALVGGVLGLITGATDAIGGYGEEAEKARREIEAATAKMQDSPEAKRVKDAQEALTAAKKHQNEVLSREGIATYGVGMVLGANRRVSDAQAGLNEALKAGTVTRSAKKAQDESANLIKELDEIESVYALFSDTLGGKVKKEIIKVTKGIDKVKGMDDVSGFARPGESPEQTKTRMTKELVVDGMNQVAKQMKEAGKESAGLGRQLFAASVSIIKAKQEFNNFQQDLPKIRQEAANAVGQASMAYLTDLTKGSSVANDLISMVQKRATAEAQSTALAQRYGLSQEDVMRSLYGFKASTNAGTDIQKYFNEKVAGAAAAYDQARLSALTLGSESNQSIGSMLDQMKKDAEAGSFALHQLGISGVKTAAQLDMIVRQAQAAKSWDPSTDRADAKKINDYLNRVKMAQAKSIEDGYKASGADVIAKKAELDNVLAQKQLALSGGLDMYLTSINNVSSAMEQGQLAVSMYNVGSAQRDYEQKLMGLSDQTVELQNKIADAADGYATTKEKLTELNKQIADASANFKTDVSKLLFDHVGKDTKMEVTVPISVDLAMKEMIDPDRLRKTVKEAIVTEIETSCRNRKR